MVTSSRRRYRIFISHSHVDNEFGIRLYDDLLRVLEKGDTVWYDRKELKLGDRWQKKIKEQLAKSNVFILLMSRAARKSGWVNHELEEAINRTVAGRGKLFIIYCDDCSPVKSLETHFQSITCKYPQDYKQTLDCIIDSLKLKAISEDIVEDTVQSLTRQMQWKFLEKDWDAVIKHTTFFIEKFPEAPLSPIYCMKSIAFLN